MHELRVLLELQTLTRPVCRTAAVLDQASHHQGNASGDQSSNIANICDTLDRKTAVRQSPQSGQEIRGVDEKGVAPLHILEDQCCAPHPSFAPSAGNESLYNLTSRKLTYSSRLGHLVIIR